NRLAVAVMNRQEIGGPRRFIISLATMPSWQLCNPKCNVTQILPVYKEMGDGPSQSYRHNTSHCQPYQKQSL
ncbi:hypothetical protein M9458_028326, partial [Cirrhinus mrigala]